MSKSTNRRRPRTTASSGSQANSRRARMAEQRARQARRRKERKVVLVVAIVLAVALVAGGITWLVVRGDTTQVAESWPIQEVQQTPAAGQPILFGTPADLAARGAAEGDKVRVEIFIDFHCPHCVTFEEDYGDIVQQAESEGRATVEVFPMAFIDQGSVNAANAFGCAADAGFPRSYFNGLFANATRTWSPEQLIALAGDLGQEPTPEFESCVTGQGQAAWVESIGTAASSRGVTGTPTVFINGEQLDFATLSEETLRAQLGG